MQASSPATPPPSAPTAIPAASDWAVRPGWTRLLPDQVRATWLLALVNLFGGLFLVAVPYEFAAAGLPPYNPTGRLWGMMMVTTSVMLVLASFYPRRLGLLDPLARALVCLGIVIIGVQGWLAVGAWPLLLVYLLAAACLIMEGLPRFRHRGLLSAWVGGLMTVLGLTSLLALGRLLPDYPQVAALFRWPLVFIGIPAGLGVVFGVWRRGDGWRIALFGLVGLLYLGLAVGMSLEAKLRIIAFLMSAGFCFLAAWSPRVPVLSGLRLQLVQSFLVASVLPLILLSMIVPIVVERTLAAQARDQMGRIAQYVAASIAQQAAAARETLDLSALTPPMLPDPAARIRVIDTRTGATLQTYVTQTAISVGDSSDQASAPRDPNLSISADAPVANTAWQVVAEESAAAVYAPVSWMIRAMLVGLLAAGAMALLLAHVLSDAFIQRIHGLRDTALALAGGDLSQRTHLSGDDELTDLGQAFNKMADQIQAGQAEMADLNAQLQEAVETRDAFISMASHELKTPLTPIKGYAQGLLRQLQRPGSPMDRERVEFALHAIDERADRLNSLVNELLDGTRVRSGRLTLHRVPVDLVALTISIVERARAAHPEGERLYSLDTPAQPVVGQWDRQRLEQVVDNLLANAVRYSPRGAEIRVSVDANGETARLCVRDEGIGIAAEDMPHLFDAYYRAPNVLAQTGGLGLGLYITRGIVEAHGGHITVESDGPGAGSLFCVVLPLAPIGTQGTVLVPSLHDV